MIVTKFVHFSKNYQVCQVQICQPSISHRCLWVNCTPNQVWPNFFGRIRDCLATGRPDAVRFT